MTTTRWFQAARRVAAMPVVALGFLSACLAAREPDDFVARRRAMVSQQIEARGVRDAAVLAAMRDVPRHEFVPAAMRSLAYEDGPLPIGEGQTISQPYIVAIMTATIRPTPSMRVLEIGTGSGYQAAVLARCVKEVDTIEYVPKLGQTAERTLRRLGYANVNVRVGDGYDGWPERAPFDAILVTAAPPQIPKPLLEQLKVGGVLVAPVGASRDSQQLVLVKRTEKGYDRALLEPVVFVPMVGKASSPPPDGRP